MLMFFRLSAVPLVWIERKGKSTNGGSFYTEFGLNEIHFSLLISGLEEYTLL